MVSHLFFYQLALIALVWLFLVLHYAWPQECAKHQRSAAREPLKPKRTRSKEPKPFAGLTQRPPCALCEREATLPQSPPPVPPDPMSPTTRRPRTVDTSQHCCPNSVRLNFCMVAELSDVTVRDGRATPTHWPNRSSRNRASHRCVWSAHARPTG